MTVAINGFRKANAKIIICNTGIADLRRSRNRKTARTNRAK